MKTKRIVMDNIIRISSKKPIGAYLESIVMRVQPKVYNEYGCIIIQCTKDLKQDVIYLCNMLWHLGLVIPKEDGIKKIEEGLKVSGGQILGTAYQIVLKKIPAIADYDDEDFKEYAREIWERW